MRPWRIAAALIAAVATGAPLEPGKPVELQIRSVEQVPVDAARGDFLRLRVMQTGTDTAVTLLDPSGTAIFASDLANGAWGPETIAVIAPATGRYSVRITSRTEGVCTVELEARRPARPPDVEVADAFAALSKAEKLRVGNAPGAIPAYADALARFRSIGDRYHAAVILYTQGSLHSRAGSFQQAVAVNQEAAALFHELGDSRRDMAASNNLAGAHDVLGNVKLARGHYENALRLAVAMGDASYQALIESNLGWLDTTSANHGAALDHYRASLERFRKLGDRRREALVLHNTAVSHASLGRHEEAVRLFEQAMEIRTKVGDRNGAAVTLAALGFSHARLGDFARARQTYESALAAARDSRDQRLESALLSRIGFVEIEERRPDAARESFDRAFALARKSQDRLREGLAISGLARAELAAGNAAGAISHGESALALLTPIGARSYQSTALETVARAFAAQGNLREARRRMEQALELLERTRDAADTGDRAGFFASTRDSFAWFARLLVRAGEPEAALEVSERARARALLETLREAGAGIRTGADPALLARERELLESLNAKGERLLPLLGRNTPRSRELRREISEIESEIEQVRARLRKESPRYASLAMPSPASARRIRESLLDSGTVLVEYLLGEERSLVWIVSRERVEVAELPPRVEIEALVEDAMRGMRARSGGSGEPARALSAIVLGPVAERAGSARLAIVPDGALQRVAFGALPVSGEPLLARNEIVMLPSATALDVLREESATRPAPTRGLALFADPVFDASDPRLRPGAPRTELASGTRILAHPDEPSAAEPLRISRLIHSREEAEAIFRLAPKDSMRALGFDANRAAATHPDLAAYRYLHFATHGYLDTANPGLSALVLSLAGKDGSPLPGFLRATDIYNMRLAADLAVLSACQTALGKEIRGEGVMGLTRAFFHAGVPRTVVSAWNVDDRATAALMTSFYRKLLRNGLRPAAALRQAQLEIRLDPRWASPFYWAAFALHGDWR